MQTRLRDKPSEIKVVPQANGSIEELNVRPDEGIEQRHTRVASRQTVLT